MIYRRHFTAVFLTTLLFGPLPLRARDCPSAPKIEYNLLDKEFKGVVPKCVSEGDVVRFTVSGVNPLLYTGTVNGVTVERHVDIPDLIKSAVLGQKSKKEESKPGKSRDETLLRNRTPGRSLESDPEIEFQSRRDNFLSHLHDLTTKAEIEELLAQAVYSSDGLALVQLEDSVRTQTAQFFGDLPFLNAPIDSAAKIHNVGADLAQLVDWAYWQAHDFYTSNPTLANTHKPAFEAMQETWDSYEKEKPKLQQKFENAARTFQVVISLRENQFAIGTTVQAKGDAIGFSFEVKRKSDLPKTAPTALETKRDDFLEIEVEGGIRVNFSTGLFFSSLNDESYVARTPAGGGDPIIERRGEEDEVSTAAGALVHVYKKGWRLPMAASFGAATSGNDVNYYLGPSLLLGKTRRWVVTGGVSLARVKRLGGGLVVGEPYTGENNNIPTESKLRFGGFLAFTFNLGGKND